MNTKKVIVARIYIIESSPLLPIIMNYLTSEAMIRGISVFRAISGFGDTGMHKTSLLDFSLNLPLTLEFFDSKETMEPALAHISTLIKEEHLIFWDALTNH